jgi:hypothetical protein
MTDAEQQRGWRLAVMELIEHGLRALSAGECVAALHIDDLLPPEHARAMGSDPTLGTLLVAWDSFSDAVDHNFPDMGEGISVAEGEQIFRRLRESLAGGSVAVPGRFEVFSRHLPFRP